MQLDLFGDRPNPENPEYASLAPAIAPERLSDEDLIAAIPNVTLADASAIAGEAGKRRLSTAIPALSRLCKRFVGYGANFSVPEQVAALDALSQIGGREAANAVSVLIVKQIVQGPTLARALTIAAQLALVLPADVALILLSDANPAVRAAACGCLRMGHEIIATLLPMMGDSEPDVAMASACALGRAGRVEALGPLKRYLTTRPSRQIVEALARVADEDAIVYLARLPSARRDLTDCVISALEEMETPRALAAADALKRVERPAGGAETPGQTIVKKAP